ncbi:MAG TPA: amidase family protein, partial [Hyphomicrobiales bacterium]
MTTDPALLSLTELAAAIRERRVSSLEATTACLARIADWQPHLNAFISIESDEALAHAKAADEALARGELKGSLHGVPMAHKDMFYSKGKVAACGSKLREGWVAPATATAVERL